jgi:hypothetical protein
VQASGAPRRQEILARERRWAAPVGAAALLTVLLLIAASIIGGAISGEGDAELLRSTQEHGSALTLSGIVDAIAFALLGLPLVYLFRVVEARAEGMQRMIIGLVVLAPICLAISTGLGVVARHNAADQFTSGKAKSTLSKVEAEKECQATLKDKGAKSFRDEYTPERGETSLGVCEGEEIEDDEAANAISEASPAALATFFGIAGGLSLVFGLFYTSLWAMRTGVLSRFWAAFGMALGVAVVLGITPFLLIWLAYLGLLIGGWVPGGRPPAWAAGEAIPWPTPGEKAASELSPEADEKNGLPAADDPSPEAEEQEEPPDERQSQ